MRRVDDPPASSCESDFGLRANNRSLRMESEARTRTLLQGWVWVLTSGIPAFANASFFAVSSRIYHSADGRRVSKLS
jgi:hypothetical protein